MEFSRKSVVVTSVPRAMLDAWVAESRKGTKK